MGKRNIDNSLETVGLGGWYQWLMCILACSVVIQSGLNVTIPIFLDYVPEQYRCYVKPFDGNNTCTFEKKCLNDTIPMEKRGGKMTYSQCTFFDRNYSLPCLPPGNASTKNCDEYVYDSSIMTLSSTMEWNLVCKHDPLRVVGQSAYMVGVMLGSFFFGIISDKYGRRIAYQATVLHMVIFTILTSFAPNFPLYIIGRFLIGMGGMGSYITAFVLSVEMVHSKHRVKIGTLTCCVYTLCYPLLTLLAYYVRDWRYLHFWAAISGVPWLLVCLVVPESPRWLASNGHYDRLHKHLARVAWSNGREMPVMDDESEASASTSTNAALQPVTLLEMFRSATLRKRLLIVSSSWFVSAIVYFGLSLNAAGLSGNIFLNIVLLGVVEAAGYIACLWLLDRFGRRLPLCATEVLAGVFCLASALTGSGPAWLPLTLALIGKFMISASFCIIYIFTGELFPTVTRNSSIGFSNVVSRVGAIIAPFILLLDDYFPNMPSVSLIIFGVTAIVVGLQVLFLPETRNMVMPDTIEEAEEISAKRGPVGDSDERTALLR